MSPREQFFARAARWLAFASAVAILFSIAASQILLGLTLVAMLLARERPKLPRIKWALGLFLLGTLIALAFSPHPSEGYGQIKKFYVYLELVVVFTCLRDVRLVRWLFLTWGGFATITAIAGVVQFAGKVRHEYLQGHAFTNQAYVAERITGFTSHWNTYSAEEMFALLMLASLLLFAPIPKRPWMWGACALLASGAVLLAETRGVWIASAVAAIYLVWQWNRKLVLLVPAAILLVFLVSPAQVRHRFESIVKPRREDSNTFRVVAWRAGLEMIKAHPLLGLGPDGPKYHFKEYIPADIPRPLPDGFYQHLHNLYLQYAADRGIPTMLVLIWMLVQILYDFHRGLRRLPAGRSNVRFLLHGGIAVVLAAMIEGFVEVNLGDTEVLTMFLVVVGCGYLALEKELAAG
jgi:putative inorganic carbon (HCO3(-)) transporter